MAELIGRLHPLIVHMPIGILILAYMMALAGLTKRFQYLNTALPFILMIGILTSILAFFTGWVMPKEGEFDEVLIGWHLWLAVAMTVSSVIVYFLCTAKKKSLNKLFVPCFSITMVLLSMTGHYGGSLTHGEGHLSDPISETIAPSKSTIEDLHIFNDIVQPILKSKCYSCHNEGKQKGGLIMSTIEGLLSGGDEGKIIIAGLSTQSPIISRIQLPLDEKKHMPPKGKNQLNDKEIELLSWWIDTGADFDKKADQLERSESIDKHLKGYLKNEGDIDLSKIKKVDAKTIQSLRAKGISIADQSEESPLLSISLSRDTAITKNKLKKLKAISKNIKEIDFSYSNVDDKMISIIGGFENLQTLKLQGTNVTSIGIEKLSKLDRLSYLNIYQTEVDDNALAALSKLKALQVLYTWKSNISAEGLSTFSEAHPLVKIENGVDDSIYGDVALKPPSIAVEQALFKNTITVGLNTKFHQVKIYYTLDGTRPDSNSLLYEKPFLVEQTTTIKAISLKSGWNASPIAQKVVSKIGHEIAKLTLKKTPNKKYSAKGAATLIDNKLGSTIFGDGSWIGYEGENAKFIIDLGTTKTISSLTVGALEDTGSFIFFPKGVEVRTSLDGNNYKSGGEIDIPISTETTPPKYQSFLVPIHQHDARFLEVTVIGVLKNPTWHTSPGAKSWIFLDEFMVN